MPNFRPKTDKNIEVNHNEMVTFNSKHSEMLDYFKKIDEEYIPKLRIEIIDIKQKIMSKQLKSLELKKIQQKINTLNKAKKKYFLQNSKYIFNYFEEKKKLSSSTETTPKEIVNSFFNIHYTESNNINNNYIKTYLDNVTPINIDINNYINKPGCNYCYEGEMIPVVNEGVMICNKCSRYIPYIMDSEKPSYKEPPKEVCFYAYKRINHFREILAQFQAKETTQIPEEVISNIKMQLKKERIKIESLSNEKTKEILKKLGYNKFYEHIPFIKHKIGISPPLMSHELEQVLCNLFLEIQAPYSKWCPKNRVNFLNYYYTIYKLCELLGENKFLSYFPMLKDRDKRIEQDSIWKKICKELDWQFIATE